YGHQTDRLRFAEAIARRVGAARAPRTAWWGWRPLAAAAILIIVAGAIFNQLEAPAPVGPSRAGIPASPAAAPAPAGPAAPFVVALALGTSRTPGATPVVVIPSRA